MIRNGESPYSASPVPFHEFYLPHVDFGVPDKRTTIQVQGKPDSFALDTIEVIIDGRLWTLRKPVLLGDELVPFEVFADAVIAGKANGPATMTADVLLQVSAEAFDPEASERTATQICWMLSLAMGQRIAWSTRGTRDRSKYSLQCWRNVHVALSRNTGRTIINAADGIIARFLQAFHPIYLKNQEWWNVTIDWYAIARESNCVEVTGLIASMLLDRVCCSILEAHEFPK